MAPGVIGALTLGIASGPLDGVRHVPRDCEEYEFLCGSGGESARHVGEGERVLAVTGFNRLLGINLAAGPRCLQVAVRLDKSRSLERGT